MTQATAPVAIGGVGGSGTRVVAAALSRSGVHLGEDLNEASDNLWFTLLFKHVPATTMTDDEFGRLVQIFRSRMVEGVVDVPGAREAVERLARRCSDQHSAAWLAERARTLLCDGPGIAGGRFGWKEPNTHLVLDRLGECIPGLRYVHVTRSGLDMALSANQNQPRLWGASLGVPYDGTPAASLRYWCAAQRRVLSIGDTMGSRFLAVRFEDLCADPRSELARILDFCQVPGPPQLVEELAGMVQPPVGLGRGVRELAVIAPAAQDLAYVGSLGFATS